MGLFEKYERLVEAVNTVRSSGLVLKASGLLIESKGPICTIGEICEIELPDGKFARAEVVELREDRVLLMPLEDTPGIIPGCVVYSNSEPLTILVGDDLIGRIINGIGDPIDGHSLNFYAQRRQVFRDPPSVINRKRITQKMHVGIKAIDGLLTVGMGQRIGIFSGSGVGKSTLLSMIARNTKADLTVICLIGERGREVLEFIERDLGEEGLKRSIVVVATSSAPPMARIRSLYSATTIAEFYRDQGRNVMLLVDSLTRLAMAQREIGISLGEQPTARGYSPSVFTMLPKILERSGTSDQGSITAFYTVLVEGDDLDEPISDAVRGILDGQIVLTRQLAMKSHYPSIDIPMSISRLMNQISSVNHNRAAMRMKELIAAHKEAEELISIGAYVKGGNPVTDEAVQKIQMINRFLRQEITEVTDPDTILKNLYSIIFNEREAIKLLQQETAKQTPKENAQTPIAPAAEPFSGLRSLSRIQGL